MSQKCANCKWWDAENKVYHPPKNYASDCKAPVPHSAVDSRKVYMKATEGLDCPVYIERKELDSTDELPEFLKQQAD